MIRKFISLSAAAGVGAVLSALAPVGARAACAPADGDFKSTTLVARSAGIDEPIKMDFDQVSKDQIDIYWVERKGAVKKYDGATKAITVLGTIVHNDEFESGVTGIILDKKFKTNKRMYIYYAFGNSSAFEYRLGRFTLGADGKLDLASEKVVLKIPAGFKKMHTGGAMDWDENGNLYLTVGENEAALGGPANTNDLRGKILRIHPEEDGTYTVPDGNLFPKGTAKTKPEIFVMGVRNAYSLRYDPVNKGIVWGDVGPDGTGVTEEDNFAKTPGNYGWPMWAGNNVPLPKASGTPAAPTNNDGANTGLNALPAARPGTYSYQQQCAVTGPIYRYSESMDSQRKFPPAYDGKWLVTDCNQGYLDTLNLNASLDGVTTHGRMLGSMHFSRPLDLKFGPDGALYVIEYAGWFSADAGTAIKRIDYTGSCSSVGIAQQSLDREASRKRMLSLLRHDGQALIPWEGLRMINGRAAPDARVSPAR
jgi:cytochrome c